MAGRISYERLLARAKAAGLTSYKIKREHIMGQATWQAIQRGQQINTTTIAALCEVLQCQPGDILDYVPEEASEDDKN